MSVSNVAAAGMARLDAAGYRFTAVERGTGQPILFVHGSVSDYRTWLPQIEAFGERFRAIAYSRRYHWPNRPIAEGADYAMDEHVEDLAAVIRSLDIAPVHLVGHSYGGFLSLLLAIRKPDLLRSLVLAEPPVVTLFVSNPPKPAEILKLLVKRPRTAAAIVKFGATGMEPATRAFRRGDTDEGLRIFGTAVLGRETFLNLSAERRRQVLDNLIRAEFLGSGLPGLRADEVRKVECPTLLLTGMRSRPLFHRLTDGLQALLPQAERVELPAASHILHEDNPPAFNAAVLAFLENHTGQAFATTPARR